MLTRRMSVVVLLVPVVLVIAAVSALTASRRQVTQPISFNHRLHIEDVGAECTDCHRHVLVGRRATIPNVEVCGDCHEEATGDSAEEASVVEHVQSGTPIPWLKVYRVPDHVLFSHRRHTAIAEISCETCHGAMATREKPVSRQAVPITMTRCIECHEQNEASTDCIVCHR